MSNEFSDHRDELCQRFRESLTRPLSERFYEEDELIDLFDYAGDLADDYLRLEVLLSGARLYPDSEPLRLRRAIFYGSFEGDAEAKFFQDNEGHGPLWDILAARYDQATHENPDRVLDDLLTRYAEFDDEEIIQFIQLAVSFNRYQWLIDHMPALEAHTDFPLTLYYEMAVVSEEAGNYDNAIRMLERLTEDDPSNAEQWFMLAKAYEREQRFDEALNAVEFALALQPVSKQMRLFRAGLFYRLERDLPRALSELEALATENPDDAEVADLLCNVNDQINGVENTYQRLDEATRKLDAPYPILTMYLLRINMEHPEMKQRAVDLLHAFYYNNEREGTNGRQNWETWARFCVESGRLLLAYTMLQVYSVDSGDPLTDMPLYLDLAVSLGDDEGAIKFVDQVVKVNPDFYKASMHFMVLYITTLLRAGRLDEVDAALADLNLDEFGLPGQLTVDSLIRRKFFVSLINAVRRHLAMPENRTAEYWRDFNPFQ